MTLVGAALLGIVQGLTEFLPISSSAHLLLARTYFGWDAGSFGLEFDVACHVGTLVAVLVYFARDLAAMAAALPRVFTDDPAARQLRLIVAGTVPVVIVGALFADQIEHIFRQPIVTVVTLSGGGLLLLWADRAARHVRDEHSLSVGEAVGFGLAQAAALVPGVSRSGATLTFGLFMGLRRDAAARFAFLLGVPAIAGAAAKEGLALVIDGMPPGAAPLFIVGLTSSAIVGYVTVKYFIRYLANHGLAVFAWYRFALAALVAAWLVARG